MQQHEAERKALAQQVKEARAEAKAERKDLRKHVASASDPANWTKNLLDGMDDSFDKADEGIERELTQATTGLVSAADFKERKERLERKREEEAANADADRERQREEAERQKKRKRQKLRQQQASMLSFEDDDGAAAESVEGAGVS